MASRSRNVASQSAHSGQAPCIARRSQIVRTSSRRQLANSSNRHRIQRLEVAANCSSMSLSQDISSLGMLIDTGVDHTDYHHFKQQQTGLSKTSSQESVPVSHQALKTARRLSGSSLNQACHYGYGNVAHLTSTRTLTARRPFSKINKNSKEFLSINVNY